MERAVPGPVLGSLPTISEVRARRGDDHKVARSTGSKEQEELDRRVGPGAVVGALQPLPLVEARATAHRERVRAFGSVGDQAVTLSTDSSPALPVQHDHIGPVGSRDQADPGQLR
jgi:hypothetical protein